MIHYHGCPFSGGTFTQLAFAGKHAMISFAANENAEMIIELCQSFCFDNGAFTSWRQGKEFDMDGFAEFVETWHRHPGFDFYCIPDVIDGDHNDNQRMRSNWFKKVSSQVWKLGAPVYHLHEPLSVLREMTNAYSRICLGSSGQYSTVGSPAWWKRMAEVMDVVTDEQGRPICKLHGLRMLDPTIFSHLPLASADSTNVARHCGSPGRWKGAYVPPDKKTRAIVMMQRIEGHASAATWNQGVGLTKNRDLFG
tara:strand:- start:1011 stop:1766 length:756 start_codon:yes stop_codon:yes gene_type:complete